MVATLQKSELLLVLTKDFLPQRRSASAGRQREQTKRHRQQRLEGTDTLATTPMRHHVPKVSKLSEAFLCNVRYSDEYDVGTRYSAKLIEKKSNMNKLANK